MDVTTSYNQGLAAAQAGNLETALEHYSVALTQEPSHIPATFARALAYAELGQVEKAIADAKQALRLIDADSDSYDSLQAAAYQLIAKQRKQQGQTEKAIAAYKLAAECYLDQEDIDGARRCLTNIQGLKQSQPAPISPGVAAKLKALPPLPTAEDLIHQALLKAQSQNLSGALADLNWIIRIDGQNALALEKRAEIRSDLRDYGGAKQDYNQALQLYQLQGQDAKANELAGAVERLGALQQQTIAERSSQQSSRRFRSQPTPTRVRIGSPSRAVQRKLMGLVGNDRDIVEGLAQRLKLKNPGRSDDWCWEKAIYDLERDRR